MTVKVTWLGCASYLLNLDGTKLLFDPFFFRNEWSKPVVRTKREDVSSVKAVYLTHAHIDHITDAAWYAENQNVPVYTSETGKQNMINWCSGNIIDFKTYPIKLMAEPYALTEKGVTNIHIIEWGDKIKISEDLTVESIQSKHIRFDLDTIMARVKSKEFRRLLKPIAAIGRGLPAGKVFSYCTSYKNLKIVSSGSLCDKYPKILKKYAPIDVFLVPLAGASAKHLAEKGGNMIDALKPKVVVPLHWDDFFPPISRVENLEPFNQLMKEKHPEVQILKLNVDEETSIDLK